MATELRPFKRLLKVDLFFLGGASSADVAVVPIETPADGFSLAVFWSRATAEGAALL